MNPIGRIIVLRNAAKRDLVNAVALITWPALIAPVIGPVLGSFITTYVSWHWNFFINIPIGLIGLALVWHFVPQQKEQDAGRLDVIGFVLSALGSPCCWRALKASSMAQWQLKASSSCSLRTYHVGVGRPPLLQDRQSASRPLGFFQSRHLRFDLSAGTASRLAINAMPFLIPLLFQVGFGLDAIATGTYILVYFAGNLAMKSVTTPLYDGSVSERCLWSTACWHHPRSPHALSSRLERLISPSMHYCLLPAYPAPCSSPR